MTDETDRLPVHDMDAERATLAAMMQAPLAVEEVAEILSPGDFMRPLHQDLFRAMVAMYAAGEPVDSVTLRAWLDRDGGVKFDPLYLADLYGLPVVRAGAASYARIVWECSVRRHVELAGLRMAQLARQLDQAPEETIAAAQQYIAALADGAVPEDNGPLTTARFCADKTTRTTAVIPGLLDHQDRVVAVGAEGAGKTTLAYQVAYCLAAGVHPFTFAQIEPGRALIIDLENPLGILQRKLGGLAALAARQPGWQEGNLTVWARPQGVDLARAADAFRLSDVVRRAAPDLIVVGPIYKMFRDAERSEHLHGMVARWCDQMRGRYGPAIWLETHAPIVVERGKRNMRPLGSGIWSRWPEFGIALARGKGGELLLDRFRGDREEGRMWPDKVSRNGLPGEHWPWEATYPPGTLMEPLGDAE